MKHDETHWAEFTASNSALDGSTPAMIPNRLGHLGDSSHEDDLVEVTVVPVVRGPSLGAPLGGSYSSPGPLESYYKGFGCLFPSPVEYRPGAPMLVIFRAREDSRTAHHAIDDAATRFHHTIQRYVNSQLVASTPGTMVFLVDPESGHGDLAKRYFARACGNLFDE